MEEKDLMTSLFPDPNSLEHYGVLGMKWGVRKDRETKGSDGKRSDKDKLEKYRQRELGKLNKKTDAKNSRLVKKVKKNNLSEKKRQKIIAKLDSIALDYLTQKKYLETMTYDEMKGEQRAVGQNFVKDLMITMGSVTAAALSPVPIPAAVVVPLSDNVRNKYRQSQARYTQDYLDYLSRYKGLIIP